MTVTHISRLTKYDETVIQRCLAIFIPTTQLFISFIIVQTLMAVESIDFNQLWDLLESEYTCSLYNRHIIALNRLTQIRADGIVKSFNVL